MIKCISAGIQAELVTFAAGTVNVRKLMDGRWVEELCCSKTSTWRDFWLSQIDINMVKCTWLQKAVGFLRVAQIIMFISYSHHRKSSKKWSNTNVNCRNTNGTGGNQGRSQDFSRGMRIFFSNLPPPPPTPNLTGRSTHIDVISSPLSTAKTGVGENDVFTFSIVPLAIWAHFYYII